jgi:hypothetical protein
MARRHARTAHPAGTAADDEEVEVVGHSRLLREGQWQEESSFCEQKEAKKLLGLVTSSSVSRQPTDKSFFASFFPKKEDSSLPLVA